MPPKKEPEPTKSARQRPAETPQDREQQMIGYADALAEEQMRAGTASSQVITHYLKLGTSREKLEQEKTRNENLRLEAQVAQIQSQARTEELVEQVLAAVKLYAGVDEDDDL